MRIVPCRRGIWVAFDFFDPTAGRKAVELARSWRGGFDFELIGRTSGILALYPGVGRP